MTRIPLFLACAALCACGDAPDDILDQLAGIDTNKVVISSEPTIVSEDVTNFPTNGSVVVVGETALVCVSLRGGFPRKSQDESMAEYARLLDGAELSVSITTAVGDSHEMSRSAYSWSKYGVIMKSDEIASCAHLRCDVPGLETGTVVNQIAVSANKPVLIQGLYWESTNRWDKAN